MMDIAFYLVTPDIARRSGLIESRHRTKDGRFILDNRDLSRITLSSDEFVNGLQGIEMISEQEAKHLIAENNYAIGEESDSGNNEQIEE